MAYPGKATTSGNSKAIRFDAALFRAHPEFASGDVVAHVLAPGTMLVTTATETTADDDPVLGAYLAYLDEQMRQHPERVRPLTGADVRGLRELLAGVVVDRDETMPDDFVLP